MNEIFNYLEILVKELNKENLENYDQDKLLISALELDKALQYLTQNTNLNLNVNFAQNLNILKRSSFITREEEIELINSQEEIVSNAYENEPLINCLLYGNRTSYPQVFKMNVESFIKAGYDINYIYTYLLTQPNETTFLVEALDIFTDDDIPCLDILLTLGANAKVSLKKEVELKTKNVCFIEFIQNSELASNFSLTMRKYLKNLYREIKIQEENTQLSTSIAQGSTYFGVKNKI